MTVILTLRGREPRVIENVVEVHYGHGDGPHALGVEVAFEQKNGGENWPVSQVAEFVVTE